MSAAKNDDNNNESFRDRISTVDESGKRVWIYPKKPKGRFYNYRTYLSFFLLVFLFAAPFIKIGGEPMLLFNIIERKFSIFGIVFWPQDFYLFVLAMITFFVFIVLFTVAFGRIFCGWFCPQTIFMEMVFRKIEYWIEGDANQQKKLAKAPWNRDKILKRLAKWSIFFVISFAIGNVLMAYLVGSEQWIDIVTHSPAKHWVGFFGVLGFSGVFFFIFANFREQACTTVCPYGRLQGVLLDQDSIVVAYDNVRGEPRGKIKKDDQEAQKQLGDCIDCTLCVQVCPTGIDIRNGTQLECVNCTACIDACDEVMDKVDRPRGLIRYASLNGIEKQIPFHVTPKIIAYVAVLVVLIGIQAFLLGSRSDFETTILRTRGELFQKTDAGNFTNLYNIQVVNKTSQELPVQLKIEKPAGGMIHMVGKDSLVVGKKDLLEATFFIELTPEMMTDDETKVVIGVYSGDKLIDKERTTFVGPLKFER